MTKKRQQQFLQNLKNLEFDLPQSTIQFTGQMDKNVNI